MISLKKKLLLAGGGRGTAFSRSGTFASNLEGWTGSVRHNPGNSSSARTLPGIAITDVGSFAEMTLAANIVKQCRITFRIYDQSGGASTNSRRIGYRIGSGPLVVLQNKTGTSDYGAPMVGTFDNRSRSDSVTFRFDAAGNNGLIIWDDWSIEGVPL